MNGPRPTINVIEKNPYLPAPFVLTEVAVCLRDSIRAAGYASEHLVNRIDPDAFSIILQGMPAFQAELAHMHPARCAIFNFEQLGPNLAAGPDYRRWLADWLVVDYHNKNVELLKRENGPGQLAFELPIVPSAALAQASTTEPTVDVLFYGTMSERRRVVIDRLQDLGLTVEVVAGAYGVELAPAVQRARLVLHVHFYETGLFPVARILQPVMQGVLIVCETSVFSPLNDWLDSGIVFAGYDELANTCAELLKRPQEMLERAQQARAFSEHIDFAGPFAAVVREFQGKGSTPPPDDVERLLTNEEIEAILAAEGAELPPEPHVAVAPVKMVERQPGKGPYGVWIVLLLMVFSFYTIWLSMKH